MAESLERWIESNGGPLILLPEHLLAEWNGTDGPSPELSDYKRACSVSGMVDVLPVADASGLVLWGEPLPTSCMTIGDRPDVLFIRWIAAESDEQVAEVLRELDLEQFARSNLFLTVPESRLVLFDSAFPGSEIVTPALRIQLLPGRYRIDTLQFENSQGVELLIHHLCLVS